MSADICQRWAGLSSKRRVQLLFRDKSVLVSASRLRAFYHKNGVKYGYVNYTYKHTKANLAA